MSVPQRFTDADALASHIARRLDNRIRLALPLGLGKSAAIANALYRRACRDREMQLDIFTALTLEMPRARSRLESRFLDPLTERLYAGVPVLDYVVDLRAGRLPRNVRVSEFYFRPGAFLGVGPAQQNHTSTNYSQAARDLVAHGINVVAQLMAPEPGSSSPQRFSLSCNPDLTLDLIDEAVAAGREPPLLVAEICEALPYLEGDAIISLELLDSLLAPPRQAALFPVPNQAVTLAEHAIAIRAATLIEDGGTLQIGIGSLGDAIAHAIAVRQCANETFRRLAGALGADAPEAGLQPFSEGLYGMSEMLVEGFLHLRRHGVLTRTVDDGIYMHAGFFLGSASFYEALRQLDGADREGLRMSRISFVNRLLGNEELKRRQRVGARFLNTAMKVTLDGTIVADALESGQVVSGVGGQHDFIAMAHALAGARSVIMLPATRESDGKLTSNIVWRYGQATVPRHLRDIVVTEYGVADLRGCSDAEVASRLIGIADSRFQGRLRDEAVDAGKLPASHRIAECQARNRPETLREDLADAGLLAELPFFPLGTDLTPDEARLSIALTALGARSSDWAWLARRAAAGWLRRRDPRIADALERLGLADPRSLGDRVLALLVGSALLDEVADSGRPLFGHPDDAVR